MKRTRPIALTVLCALLLSGPLASVASAATPATETVADSATGDADADADVNPAADAVAEVISEAVANTPELANPVETADGTLAVMEGSFLTQMPASTGEDVQIDPVGSIGSGAASTIGIGLPVPAGVEAAVASNGSVVYQDSALDVAVAVQTSAHSVRMVTVLENSEAPTRFAYPIQGADPQLNASGGVDLYDHVSLATEAGEKVEQRVVVLSAEAPWARDASGRALPTHYEVDGGTVYQVVETDSTTQYPVVADPNWLKIGKCAAAVAYVAFSAAFVVGKSVAIVKAVRAAGVFVREVGGATQAAKLIVGTSTAAERTAFFAKARSIAGASILDFLGVTAIRTSCF